MDEITENVTAGDNPGAEEESPASGEAAPAPDAPAPESATSAPEPAAPAPDESTPAPDAADHLPEAATPESKHPPQGEGQAQHPAKKWRRDPVLAMAFRKGLPIDGKIEAVIKGGYEVRLGKARGFCPHSQLELHHVDAPDQYVGRTLPFRVLQLRRGGEEAVLSRRALLEERLTDERKAVRATLIEGHVTQGHVVRVTEFGAFVDLGAGVTGLVHVSEIAHGRVPRAADVLAPGQTVQVKVLKLDEESGKISLSIRQAARDPWDGALDRFHEGEVVSGTVRRVVDFGAFVELDGEIEALAPADGFAPAPEGWSAGVTPGSTGRWRIVSVDGTRRRMAIYPVLDGESGDRAELTPGARIKGRVQRVERFGVFVWIRGGVVGLMPGMYTGTRKGTDLSRAFTVGREIDVEVVEVDPEGKRIRLAVPGAATKQESAAPPPQRRDRERREPEPSQQQAPPQAFGTSLADVLRAAMKKGSGTDA